MRRTEARSRGTSKSRPVSAKGDGGQTEESGHQEEGATGKEQIIDPEIATKSVTKSRKGTSEAGDSQSKIDKHLRPVENFGTNGSQLDETLKGFSDKLGELASQAYIESMFKKMVTQEFFSKKVKELERELKENVKKEIEKVTKQVDELRNRLKKSESTTENLRCKISDMETVAEKAAEECRKIREENKKMAEQLHEREVMLDQQSRDINDLEQYTRRNSVRIYGVDDKNAKESHIETAKSVVRLVKDKLGVEILSEDIDIAHRMGRYREDGNRPIICKFLSRYTKHAVIRARRQLKNTAIVIREDLTLKNAKLLERTVACDQVRTAWSDEGRVIALLNNGRKLVVDHKTDLRGVRE